MVFNWLCCNSGGQDKSVLEDILPPDFNYNVVKFKVTNDDAALKVEKQFNAKLQVNICSEDSLRAFLTEFSTLSTTRYNHYGNDKRTLKNSVISGYRKCIHFTRKRIDPETKAVRSEKTEGQQTECPANLHFKIKKHICSASLDGDICTNYACEITLDYSHNHVILAAEAAKYHPVSENTKRKFLDLFHQGYGASKSLNIYKEYLRDIYKEDYIKISSNRSYLPDYKWVFNFHAKYNQEKFGSFSGPDSIKLAIDHALKYNEKQGADLCKVHQTEDGHYIVVILDPLTLRVHQEVPQAGDIVLCDATSSLDRVDSKLFRFLTVSPSGGLPLGIIITSSESQDILTTAFTMYRDMLPSFAFHNRGRRGPKLFVTDDCTSEISSLKAVWPESFTLLCQWHLLQVFTISKALHVCYLKLVFLTACKSQ